MFHIKICGVREIAHIEAVFSSGADAIGLNFYPPSCRFIDPLQSQAAELASKASELGLARVGVFVNHPVERVQEISQRLGLDAVQLHGDEQPEDAVRLQAGGVTKLIRAIKLPVGELTVQEIETRASPWAALGVHLLLDADGGNRHGGTGQTLNWAVIKNWADQAGDASWTLAGGLNPDNVATAIAESGASSVDTASGVEAERGAKSENLIRQFSDAASVLRTQS